MPQIRLTNLFYLATLTLLGSKAGHAESYTLNFLTKNGSPTARFDQASAQVHRVSVVNPLKQLDDTNAEHIWTTGWEQNSGNITKILTQGGYIEIVCQLPTKAGQITSMELNACRPTGAGPTRMVVTSSPGRFAEAMTLGLVKGEATLGKASVTPNACTVQAFTPSPVEPQSGIISFRLYAKGRSKEYKDSESTREVILKSLTFETDDSPATTTLSTTPKTAPSTNTQTTTITLDAGRQAVDGKLEPAATIEGAAQLASADVGSGVSFAMINVDNKKPGSEAYDILLQTISLVKWSKAGSSGQVTLENAIQAETYFEFGVQFDSSVNQITGIRLEGMRRTDQTPIKYSLISYRPDEELVISQQALAKTTIEVPLKGKFSESFTSLKPIKLKSGKTRIFRFYAHDYPTEFKGKSNALFIDKIHFEVQ